ncbi:MAG: VOC family protein, partial [Planctomycetes bacterium]|nr:VOC family protein [Planctomycetota bacterium]
MSTRSALAIQPRLPVASLDPAIRFYCEVLGFESPSGPPSPEDQFAILERDQIGLQLVIAGPDHPAGQLTLWIHVADAQAEYEAVRDKTPIEWGPEVYWYGCREFAVRDPDGHRI